MEKHHSAYFEDVIETCIRCGLCTKVQAQVGCPEHDYAEFAQMMLDADSAGEYSEVSRPVWSCSMCGACTSHCPASIDAYTFMYHARSVLNPEQPDVVQQFAPMRTNCATSTFALLRKLRDPGIPDALESGGTCKKLFFPGCSLSSYAPDLARAVYDRLQRHGNAEGITFQCCGNPFLFMGEPQNVQYAAESLAQALVEHGVEELIVACPSCYYALRSYRERGTFAESLVITPLPTLLASQGMMVDLQVLHKMGFDSICIQDSCRDRFDGLFAAGVRALLRNIPCVELEHCKRDSRCCGSGGLVALYSESAADFKRLSVLEEFDTTKTSCLVTMCVNCSAALRQDGDTAILHYLELLFDQPIDWNWLENAFPLRLE